MCIRDRLSAGCILFLFWSITRLVRALLVGDERKLSVMDVIIILGAGFVGALAYTFSDTFWFSAVEGEVYAFSSFLTALVFWMILRWQDEADSVSGDRWIILIAYIIGLSIGVHLLNLLCIPAVSYTHLDVYKRQLVRRLLDQLSPRQREALTLYYIEEKKYEDICEIMNMNYQSLRNLMHRGLTKLRSLAS